MKPESLTADDIRALLAGLGRELDDAGVRGELFDVGGAAMALAYNSRRATADVDAVFEPKAVIYEAAHRIAERHGLPDDWLNDAMKGFLPGTDPQQRAVFEERGITVSVPSPEYLLAMKVAAARIDRDRDESRRRPRSAASPPRTRSLTSLCASWDRTGCRRRPSSRSRRSSPVASGQSGRRA